jgi:hypothetical protein
MVEILNIAYGIPWKSGRRRWIRKGEKVRLYISKTTPAMRSHDVSWPPY